MIKAGEGYRNAKIMILRNELVSIPHVFLTSQDAVKHL